jgi:hypothetical protein
MALTRFQKGMSTFVVDSNAVEKTANYTVIINTDSGKTFTCKTDGVVFTLPSIAIGNTYTFVNTAGDGVAGLTISPAALDGITYTGSEVDNKDLINTKATSKLGDSVTLASLNGVVAWQVVEARGIWAKEA